MWMSLFLLRLCEELHKLLKVDAVGAVPVEHREQRVHLVVEVGFSLTELSHQEKGRKPTEEGERQ